jgi:tRNA 2-(methylsulfanyl)-N6-isopentenyladenosine37 hydroxylase
VALGDLEAVLSDHVHCERKAAQSALSLVRSYPHRADLVDAAARLAHEETAHVVQVQRLLGRRGSELRFDEGDEYARRLRAHIRRDEPGRLLDTLLVFALIEARSAERLALLAGALAGRDPDLADTYRALAAAEVRHRDTFLSLAAATAPRADYDARAAELAAAEADLVARLPLRARIH